MGLRLTSFKENMHYFARVDFLWLMVQEFHPNMIHVWLLVAPLMFETLKAFKGSFIICCVGWL